MHNCTSCTSPSLNLLQCYRAFFIMKYYGERITNFVKEGEEVTFYIDGEEVSGVVETGFWGKIIPINKHTYDLKAIHVTPQTVDNIIKRRNQEGVYLSSVGKIPNTNLVVVNVEYSCAETSTP